jgi:hypothetical protein
VGFGFRLLGQSAALPCRRWAFGHFRPEEHPAGVGRGLRRLPVGVKEKHGEGQG